ncbi:MAG TPA: hypothetical protein VMV74_05290 [Bacteroidales bacterium]|nr:hypothetical protein [Bacteroidales bacterium]
MEDKGLGNIIFYIILAIIALVGSFSNKKKKTTGTGAPKKTFRWPDLSGETTSAFPEVFESRVEDTMQTPQPAPGPAAKPVPQSVIIDEGHYEDPMAELFKGEGSYNNPMADRFAREGSMTDELAKRFSREGSIENSMAAAYSSEGMSVMNEAQILMSTDNTISDNEIGDAEEYDYEAYKNELEKEGGFNVHKAVVYSAILNRKEYTF